MKRHKNPGEEAWEIAQGCALQLVELHPNEHRLELPLHQCYVDAVAILFLPIAAKAVALRVRSINLGLDELPDDEWNAAREAATAVLHSIVRTLDRRARGDELADIPPGIRAGN